MTEPEQLVKDLRQACQAIERLRRDKQNLRKQANEKFAEMSRQIERLRDIKHPHGTKDMDQYYFKAWLRIWEFLREIGIDEFEGSKKHLSSLNKSIEFIQNLNRKAGKGNND